jgi:hypothetical protein
MEMHDGRASFITRRSVMNLELQIRELTLDELLAVSGAKPKVTKPKSFKETCTTVYYDDGTNVRTCVPDKS